MARYDGHDNWQTNGKRPRPCHRCFEDTFGRRYNFPLCRDCNEMVELTARLARKPVRSAILKPAGRRASA